MSTHYAKAMRFEPKEMTTRELIRLAREARGWTQGDLARAFGTREQTIWRWEAGVSGVKKKKLDKLCLVFGVPLGSLNGVDR